MIKHGSSTAIDKLEEGLAGMTNSTWAKHVVNKLGHLLQTHVLQIDVIAPANIKGKSSASKAINVALH